VIPRLAARLASGLAAAIGLALILPATVAAHALNPTYTSRLPLAVYVVGAATAVALSFAFVIVRDVRAAPPDLTSPGTLPPVWQRFGLRIIGLIGWLWIVGQGIAGGASDGEVATLFLWNYGWVGLAIVCAIIGPAWHFLDPFSTIHDMAAWVLARAHVQGWAPADYPERLGRWPGTIGFAVFVWLELVMQAGPTLLFVVLVGYTAYTLAMMAQFGRDEWRARGETFTVWFRLLGRLAWFRLVDEEGRELPVFDIGLCKVGMVICYDNSFPELARILALRGAEVLLMPHAARLKTWEENRESESAARSYASHYYRTMIPCRARENACFAIVADQAGRAGYVDRYPRNSPAQPHHPGGAFIFDPQGDVVAATQDERIVDEMIVADLDVSVFNTVRSDPNFTLRTRRPELFGELVKEQISS
jgi:hypothetical protein